MAGNTTGDRRYYDYVSDGGVTYALLLDTDLAEAGGLSLSANPANFPPRRFSPRVVYLEAEIDGKKVRKACPSAADGPLYNASVSGNVTIDEQEFYSTGRAGEKLTFARNPD